MAMYYISDNEHADSMITMKVSKYNNESLLIVVHSRGFLIKEN